MDERIATAIATPNIAFVKYWGNRDERLILPAGGSISMTLDRSFTTTTTACFSSSLKRDEIWLNEKRVGGKEAGRIIAHIDLMRRTAKCTNKLHAKVSSSNNFPTAAGLASSASGFAALTLACAKALRLKRNVTELSALARRGSGSACRSLFGGFVEWVKGMRKDGRDSVARQIAPRSHWPELIDVVAIVSEGRKRISSRDAMTRAVRTSRMFGERMKRHPITLRDVKTAILRKKEELLFDSIMRESDSMHAVMKDSRPPIVYMTDVSRKIADAVRKFNAGAGGSVCGYTFDAGPNAHVITTKRRGREVRRMLSEIVGVKRILVGGVGEGPAYSAKHLFKI